MYRPSWVICGYTAQWGIYGSRRDSHNPLKRGRNFTDMSLRTERNG